MNGFIKPAARALLLSLGVIVLLCVTLSFGFGESASSATEATASETASPDGQLVPADPNGAAAGSTERTVSAETPARSGAFRNEPRDLEGPVPPRSMTHRRRSAVFIETPREPKSPRKPLVSLERHLEVPAPATRPQAESGTHHLETRLAGLERRLQAMSLAQSQSEQLERAKQLIQQLEQDNQLENLQKQLEAIKSGKTASTKPNDGAGTQESETGTQTGSPSAPSRPPVLKAEPTEGERFSLQIQDSDITEVLEMLGQLAGMNILVGTGVSGTVTANLDNVTVQEALDGILKSLGYVYERDGNFVFVLTAAEAEARKQLDRKVVTKVYRPNYISVADLQSLITPLLSESVGKVAVTNPAETGINADPEKAGADTIAQQDALLVQDYAEVIEEIDQIFQEMDIPPRQVVIEAMILSVTLDDDMEFGVNFALLNDSVEQLAVFGNGQTLNNSNTLPDGSGAGIVPGAGEFIANASGLKYGAVTNNVGAFVKALENIADTNLVASPQLRVLNKQKAQLIIGERISYKTLAFNGTQTVENVQFLDSGTKLFFRPYIAPDGIVRMAIHPERSSAVIDPNTGLPNQQTTEVTTNVLVRDGNTIVIGGLIEEQVSESYSRVPFLGALPMVGPAFRNKSESIKRTELIVLITPRIVHEDEAASQGEVIEQESEHRAANFRNNLSPINRRNLARMEYEKAQDYYEQGRYLKARLHVNRALRHSHNDLNILRLRDQIEAAIRAAATDWIPGTPEPLPASESTETSSAQRSQETRTSKLPLPQLWKR